MIALVGALLLTVVALAVNASLLSTEAGRDLLTPDAPRVVQNFISALSADRPAIAQNFVDETARRQLSRERLEAFASTLRSRHGGFRFDDATEEQRQNNAASVRTALRTPRGEPIALTFRLARHPSTHLWKIVEM